MPPSSAYEKTALCLINGVKNDIQEISQKLTHHRLAGLSLGADDIRVAVGNQHKRTGAAYNRQIGFRIVSGFRACANHGENLIHENQEQCRHQHPDGNTAPHTERADLFCVVSPSLAQGAGDHRGTADAEDCSHGHEQQENRRGKGDCRHLQIVMGLPDEKGIRHSTMSIAAIAGSAFCKTALRIGAFAKTSIDLLSSITSSEIQ